MSNKYRLEIIASFGKYLKSLDFNIIVSKDKKNEARIYAINAHIIHDKIMQFHYKSIFSPQGF